MPPPSTALSTDSVNRRGSVAVSDVQPTMTFACSVARRTVSREAPAVTGSASASPRRGAGASPSGSAQPPSCRALTTCSASASWSTLPAAVTTSVAGR